MEHSDCRKVLIIGGVCFLLICVPVLLNAVLLMESPLKYVIGGNEAPKEWLHFWGAYLAAIGSSSAAIVAIVNERKNRKRVNISSKINKMQLEYNQIERDVSDFLKLHSILRLVEIVRVYDKSNPIIAEQKQNQLFLELQDAIIKGERYMALYKGIAGPYISALGEQNKHYLLKSEEIKSILVSASDEINEATSNELYKIILNESEDPDQADRNEKFYNESLNFLSRLRSEIISLNEQLEKI